MAMAMAMALHGIAIVGTIALFAVLLPNVVESFAPTAVFSGGRHENYFDSNDGPSSRAATTATATTSLSWQRISSPRMMPRSSRISEKRQQALLPLALESHHRDGSIIGSSSQVDEHSRRRSFLRQFATIIPSLALLMPPRAAWSMDDSPNDATKKPFHSAAYGREEYTNSIVASRDTNISPREVYDTIASDYLREAFDAAKARGGRQQSPRALDVGAGAGVSTQVLYDLGYHNIDALDWSGAAWEKYVVESEGGNCPPGVTFYELDDERYLEKWRERYSSGRDDGKFDVIVFNFAVNESKAAMFARNLLNEENGRLLAPINTSNDYWMKQTYKVMDSRGNVLWDAVDVGAWSVQFQPDVTQDTCSGIWCAPFNGFQKKK